MVSVNGRRGGCAMREPLRRGLEFAGRQALPSSASALQVHLVAVEHQRRVAAALRVGAEREGRGHPRRGRVQPDIELDPVDQEVAGPVILKANDRSRVVTHGNTLSLWMF